MEKEKNRLIRERIIEAARKEEIDIPPLSREFIEIIDPGFVDSTLLEMIENGGEELTDLLFFECISESPKYLVYEPFQEKIARWQDIMRDESTSEDERFKIRENLKKIGTILAFIGSGRRKDIFWEVKIYLDFLHLMERLEPIMPGIGTKKSYGNRILAFKERCPDLSKYADLTRRNKTALSLSKAIIIEKYKIQERTVDRIVKENQDMVNRTKAIKPINVPKGNKIIPSQGPTKK